MQKKRARIIPPSSSVYQSGAVGSGFRRNDGDCPLSHVWERVRVRAQVQSKSSSYCRIWLAVDSGESRNDGLGIYFTKGMNRPNIIVKNDAPKRTAPINNRVMDGPANPLVS